MSKFTEYKEKLRKIEAEKAKARLDYCIKGQNPSFSIILIHSILVVVLAESVNWIFGLPEIHAFWAKLAKFLELEAAMNSLIIKIQPYIIRYFDIRTIMEAMPLALDWAWLLPYAVFSYLSGVVYTSIRQIYSWFKIFFITSILVAVIKALSILISFIIPYGFISVFLYLPDFIRKFYLIILSTIPVSYIFLYIGSEMTIFWKNNFGKDSKHFWEK